MQEQKVFLAVDTILELSSFISKLNNLDLILETFDDSEIEISNKIILISFDTKFIRQNFKKLEDSYFNFLDFKHLIKDTNRVFFSYDYKTMTLIENCHHDVIDTKTFNSHEEFFNYLNKISSEYKKHFKNTFCVENIFTDGFYNNIIFNLED
jgi:hypothetical protein